MTQPRPVLETVATVLLTVTALVVASVYIYTQLLDGGPSRMEVVEVDEVENWREETALGIWLGPTDARMVVTEFMDFTCPFCAQIVPAIDSLLARYPDDVALVFQHFPLDGRPHSRPSAVVAECAERQGKFESMYRLLFAQQKQIGRKEWSDFGREVGIPDLSAFEDCLRLPADSFPRIEAGRELGMRRSVGGTPTLYINGRRFRGRSFEQFHGVAEELGLSVDS